MAEPSTSKKDGAPGDNKCKGVVARRMLSAPLENLRLGNVNNLSGISLESTVVIILKFDGTWNGLHGIFPTYPTITSNLLIQHLGIEVIQAIKSPPNSLMKTCSKIQGYPAPPVTSEQFQAWRKFIQPKGHYDNLESLR